MEYFIPQASLPQYTKKPKRKNPVLQEGIFILFEGIDGSGKTSHSKRVWMDLGRFFPTTWSCEPTHSPYGQELRKSFVNKRLSSEEECQLFIKDRELHVKKYIEPGLDAKHIVLLDRYEFSNLAYQGTRPDIQTARVLQLNARFPKPHLTFVLDVPVSVAMDRILEERTTLNQMEKQESLERARQCFLEYPYPNKVIIHATGNQKIVYEEMLAVLFKRCLCPQLCPNKKLQQETCLTEQQCILSEMFVSLTNCFLPIPPNLR